MWFVVLQPGPDLFELLLQAIKSLYAQQRDEGRV